MELTRGRPPMDDLQFSTACGAIGTDASAMACLIRAECEAQLTLPRQSLHPADNLVEIFDWLDLGELVDACSEAAACRSSPVDHTRIDGTVASIVRAILESAGRPGRMTAFS